MTPPPMTTTEAWEGKSVSDIESVWQGRVEPRLGRS